MKKGYIFIFLIVSSFFNFIYSANTDIRLNSLGFLPTNDKIATIHWTSAPTNWYLLTSPGNVTVTSGTFSAPMSDAQTGETNNLYLAIFSSYTTEGTYYLNVPTVGKSSIFDIRADVYNDPFVPVFKAMYEWRCGTAVTVTYGGNTFSHAACHMNDAYDDNVGGTGTKKASLKGWHDAGDYGKYIVNAGITMGCLFDAWDMFGTQINSLSYGLPSTAPGYPEFLEELKWETDWMLTMQAANGSVYEKVSTVDFDPFELPELDTATRYFWGWNNVGTAETGQFCAVMAMAARYFQPYDAAYATTCLNAATSAYNFLTGHLTNTTANVTGCNTGIYTGSDPNAARLWAAVEMWETIGTGAYLTDAETRINGMNPKIDTDWDWNGQKNLGMFTYLLSTRTGKNATTYNAVYNALITSANTIVSTRNSHAYGRSLGTNYYWGCNGSEARAAMILQIANQLSPNASYINTALDAIGYLFGRNMHDRSYVTGVGINPAMNPHHRPSGGDTITNPWPGYLVGGSSGGRGDLWQTANLANGLPAAQYWSDVEDSYSSNEVAINWQGALIYAMAGFVKNPASPTATPTSTATPTNTPYAGTPTSTFTITPLPTLGVVAPECVQGSTFIIDGNLNEPEWSTGTWTSVTRVVNGTSPAPVSARYKTKWDSTYLYVGVEVTDSALHNDSVNYYDDDSVEVYIDANHNQSATYAADDWLYGMGYNDTTISARRTGVAVTTVSVADTFVITGGYSVEYRIPWTELGKTATTGLTIGFDVAVNYDQNGGVREGVIMWNGTGNNWTDTSDFGDAILQECQATSTFTNTATPTFTRTLSVTNTRTPSLTVTNTITKTNTAVNTFTSTSTASPTNTKTIAQSPTDSPTVTLTSTGTPPTNTFTSTITKTFTITVTNTFTKTATPTFTITQTQNILFTSTCTATPTFTATEQIVTPISTITPEAIVWPCPINPQTQNLYVRFDLTEIPTSVKFKVYTKAYRLVKSVEISGTVPSKINEGIIAGARLRDLSNGLYLYVIENTINGKTKRSKIQQFIIIK